MPAPTDPENQAELILDKACWLQRIICQGCTNLFHDSAKFVDEKLVLSKPRCLNPDCVGHDPTMVYLKALQFLADHDVFPMTELACYGPVQRKEATDASAD